MLSIEGTHAAFDCNSQTSNLLERWGHIKNWFSQVMNEYAYCLGLGSALAAFCVEYWTVCGEEMRLELEFESGTVPRLQLNF
jgi:hypothetical protein